MSFYPLAPPPHQHTTHAWWTGGFSKEDCEKIVAIGESLEFKEARVGLEGASVLDTNVRISRTSWIKHEHAPWVYDRLGYYIRQLNGEFFQFDITGFWENMQYTVYESSDAGNGFYDWHIDEGFDKSRPPRKLSVSVQLSDPTEYEGGELILNPATTQIIASKEQGHMIMFPSFYHHRVAPVTKGARRSLVVWLTGPRFR